MTDDQKQEERYVDEPEYSLKQEWLDSIDENDSSHILFGDWLIKTLYEERSRHEKELIFVKECIEKKRDEELKKVSASHEKELKEMFCKGCGIAINSTPARLRCIKTCKSFQRVFGERGKK